MLEFLLCAAAKAARLSGYWAIVNNPLLALLLPPFDAVVMQFELFIAAAYYTLLDDIMLLKCICNYNFK